MFKAIAAGLAPTKQDASMTPFDSKEFRRALGAFPTGVTVITTCDDAGKPYGVTANSFSSVSLDPPLILWSQSTTSSSYPAFRDCPRFVVNILGDHQVHVSNQFAKSGADKFREVPVKAGLGGVPIIDDCAAHLECVKVAAYPGGDHVVYLGQVEKIFRSGRHSLAFGDGRYLRTFAHDLGEVGSQTGAAGLGSLKAQRIALAALPAISERIGQRTVGIAVWGNQGATIIGWEPSAHPVSPFLQAGVVVSLTQSATGVAFAAFMPPEQTQSLADEELQARSRSGQPDNGQFAQRVAEARHHGLARAVGTAASPRHHVTVNAFSAPVYDAQGNMVMAISTTCEAERLSEDWDGEVPTELLAAARELSQRLGHADA